jgi:Holliday junction resolvasome RuvABC endonuclease subunit
MLPIPEHTAKEVVLFIDQSTTKVGYSVLESGVVTAYGTHILGYAKRHSGVYARVRHFETLIKDFVLSVAPDKVYCEGGTYSGGGKSREACRALATVEYFVAEVCHDHQLPFDTIHNSTLKSAVCRIAHVSRAKGDRSKDPVGESVRKYFGMDAELEFPPDTADAVAMAIVYAHGEHIPQSKRKKESAQTQCPQDTKGHGAKKLRKGKDAGL